MGQSDDVWFAKRTTPAATMWLDCRISKLKLGIRKHIKNFLSQIKNIKLHIVTDIKSLILRGCSEGIIHGPLAQTTPGRSGAFVPLYVIERRPVFRGKSTNHLQRREEETRGDLDQG